MKTEWGVSEVLEINRQFAIWMHAIWEGTELCKGLAEIHLEERAIEVSVDKDKVLRWTALSVVSIFQEFGEWISWMLNGDDDMRRVSEEWLLVRGVTVKYVAEVPA